MASHMLPKISKLYPQGHCPFSSFLKLPSPQSTQTYQKPIYTSVTAQAQSQPYHLVQAEPTKAFRGRAQFFEGLRHFAPHREKGFRRFSYSSQHIKNI